MVRHGALAVVLHHLSGAAIGSDQHPRHLIALNGLHEIAVAKRARRIGWIGTVKEGRTHGDHHHGQEHVEARITPALLHLDLRCD